MDGMDDSKGINIHNYNMSQRGEQEKNESACAISEKPKANVGYTIIAFGPTMSKVYFQAAQNHQHEYPTRQILQISRLTIIYSIGYSHKRQGRHWLSKQELSYRARPRLWHLTETDMDYSMSLMQDVRN